MSDLPRPKLLIHDDNTLIHPIVKPEEVRSGDPISIEVMCDKKFIRQRLWSYCPFGFEFNPDPELNYSVGDIISFRIAFDSVSYIATAKIIYKTRNNSVTLLGARIELNRDISSVQNKDKRTESRWSCPRYLLPTGSCTNPVRFNDYIYFRIIDISSNGLKLATSLRNKFLSPNQILESIISIPMIGSASAHMKIERIAVETIDNKPELILGVSLVNRDKVFMSSITEYLLTFSPGSSVRTLAESGFQVTDLSKFLDFSYVKTAQEYDEVVSLRVKSYRHSSKLKTDIPREYMIDEFDSRSRILVVKNQGRIIGSIRAMFHDDGDRTSHERYLKFPENFPKISEAVEISRMCVDPDFRGAEIATALATHVALLTIKSGRRYLFGSSEEKLLPFWGSTGMRAMGVKYIHHEFGDIEHELVLNDLYKSIAGERINHTNWKKFYSEAYEYCVQYGLIDISAMQILKRSALNILHLFRSN